MEQLKHIEGLLDGEQYSDALQQCEQLIQETGGRGEVALLTARALIGLARLQEAETWVQRARNDMADESEALRLLARIYRRRGWRVRAQAIERRVATDSTSRPAPTVTPTSSDESQSTAPSGGAVVPTLDAPERLSSRMASALPKFVTTSDTNIPTLERPAATGSARIGDEEPPTVAEEAADHNAPVVADPLGLLSPEEAEAVRTQGAVRAVEPDPPDLEASLEPPTPGEEGAGATAPTAKPTAASSPREPRNGPSPEPSPTDDAFADPVAALPVTQRQRVVDQYTAQRRRSKLLLGLGVLLTLTAAIAAVVVYRAWREETRQRTLLTTQRQIDAVDYEGLKAARETLRHAIGGSPNPDGTLCARGSQVELYLWMYYTGERSYLQQAKELMREAEIRDRDAVETRFTRALWEGYLGDVSVTLDLIDELQDDPALRADRCHLLRGVAASAVGDHARAARHFEEAVSLAPTALNHLAFARAAQRCRMPPDAVDQLEAIEANHPGHLLAQVDLALLGAGPPTGRGYLDDVEAVLQQYNGQVPHRVMARVFAAKALGYGTQGNFKAAADWYSRALDEDPENPDILRSFGHELRVRGDLTDARAQLSRIVKNQPYSGDSLGELGIIAYLQDRPSFLSEHLESFPDGARRGAAYTLAAGLRSLADGDADKAVQRIERTPEDLWGGEARLLLGEAQLAAGNPAGAAESFEAATRLLRQYRGEPDPLVSAARVARERARDQMGERVNHRNVERALEEHGRYPIVLYQAAQLAEVRGEHRKASTLYRKAFERGQDFSLALVGFVRASQGDSSATRLREVAADTYLRISPDGPNADWMRSVVRNDASREK